jgi:hypothetical protein
MLVLEVGVGILIIVADIVGKEFVLALVAVEYAVTCVVPLSEVVAASVIVLILEVDVGMLIIIAVPVGK